MHLLKPRPAWIVCTLFAAYDQPTTCHFSGCAECSNFGYRTCFWVHRVNCSHDALEATGARISSQPNLNVSPRSSCNFCPADCVRSPVPGPVSVSAAAFQRSAEPSHWSADWSSCLHKLRAFFWQLSALVAVAPLIAR